jgi:chromosome segregation ATPase
MHYQYSYGAGPYPDSPTWNSWRQPPYPPYGHPAAHNHLPYPPRRYWQPTRTPESPFLPTEADWEKLEMLNERLGRENEDLRSEARFNHTSLDEQLETNAHLKRKLAQQAEEVKSLNEQITNLDTEVAGKNEEIKELKVKIGKYQRQFDERKEENEKFRRIAEKYEKELSEWRTKAGKMEVELGRVKEENRLGRIELNKTQNVNRNGRALVKKLKLEKQKIWEKLEESSKRAGAKTAFEQTLTEVLDKSQMQGKTIESMATNILLQKSHYEYIIGHYNKSYNELHRDFRVVHDLYKENYELKEATNDSPFTHYSNYDRSADIIRVECMSNFSELETLISEFADLRKHDSQVGSAS